MDIRHTERQKIVQELYSLTFVNSYNQPVSAKAKLIYSQKDKINTIIKQFAPKFPLDKIAKIDLVILQLSVYDLIIEKKQPFKVIINEAVELAKDMGSDRSYAFINAVLGKVYEKFK